MKQLRLLKTVLWTARVWSSLILAFVLFFLIAHILGTITGSGEPVGKFANIQEVIAFICFPIGTIVGLALAYKWEGLGGLIASVGLIIMLAIMTFSIPQTEQLSVIGFVKHFSIFIFFILPPGLLYLLYWYLINRNT